LGFVGLDGRLRLEWISSAEGQKFARVIKEFTEQIRAMGPSPIRVRMGRSQAAPDWATMMTAMEAAALAQERSQRVLAEGVEGA
jgi:hypothetical protein